MQKWIDEAAANRPDSLAVKLSLGEFYTLKGDYDAAAKAYRAVLNQDPKKFLEGKPGPGTGFDLDWICGFSIPIITICAFIVLNIFLVLLNLLFFWLPFVKVCIPFPRKK